ncbi:MAG TPA: hypothetical protein DD734_03840 [Firmicutes bacterium]|nr:hypothetical protein [Bacillota bacterium]
MVGVTKTETKHAVLVDITPPEAKAARFLRMKGRTGRITYNTRLQFYVPADEKNEADGFITTEFTREPEMMGKHIVFHTRNSTYKFLED